MYFSLNQVLLGFKPNQATTLALMLHKRDWTHNLLHWYGYLGVVLKSRYKHCISLSKLEDIFADGHGDVFSSPCFIWVWAYGSSSLLSHTWMMTQRCGNCSGSGGFVILERYVGGPVPIIVMKVSEHGLCCLSALSRQTAWSAASLDTKLAVCYWRHILSKITKVINQTGNENNTE